MAILTEQDLKKEVHANNFQRLYFIYGEEKYLVKKCTDYLRTKLVGKNPTDFDYAALSSNASIEQISEAVEQLPLMTEKRLVCVTDLDFEQMSESDMKLLTELCCDLPDTTVLLFAQPTLMLDTKKSGKTKKFSACAERNGAVLRLDKKGDIVLEKQIMSWVQKLGCSISQVNASKIVNDCGTDMTTLKNEVEKLCAYTKEGEISQEAISLVCVKNLEARIFSLSDSIIRQDYNSVYKQLDLLFFQREKPELILGVLSSAFVDIYRVKATAESGEKASYLKEIFPYKNKEFRLKNAERDAKKFSSMAISKILDAIADTDIKLKSTRSDGKLLLETLIARILIIVKEDNAK